MSRVSKLAAAAMAAASLATWAPAAVAQEPRVEGAAPDATTNLDAPPSATQKAPRFGDAGQVVLSGSFGLGVGAAFYEDPKVYSTSVTVSPAFEYFVIPNVSLGGGLEGSWSTSQSYGAQGSIERRTETDFSGFVSLGYNIPLVRYVSFWPQAHFGFSSETRVSESSADTSAAAIGRSEDLGGFKWRYVESGLYVSAFAPIVLHPVPHFFVGGGPYVYRDLGRTVENAYPTKNDRTTVSFRLTVGVAF